MGNRPLTDLKESSTTIVTDINDLPATSPHAPSTMQEIYDLQLIRTRHVAQQRHTVTHVVISHATDWTIAAASVGTMKE
jgi:hypothetical protein